MEWGRAKTILVVTFFFLNVLLGLQLWADKFDLFGFSFGGNEEIESVKQHLQNKGIVLKQEITTETPKVREIYVKYKLRAEQMGRIPIHPPVSMKKQRGEESWQEKLKGTIVHFNDYETDPLLSSEHQLVLNQVIGGLPLFQFQITLWTEEEQVTAYLQSFAELQPSDDVKEQPALAAHRVIRFLADKVLKQGDVIEDIRLGYHGQLIEGDSQVLAPKWRIALASGQTYYVHAIYGSIESTEE